MRLTVSKVEMFSSTQATTIHVSKYKRSSKPKLLIFMTDSKSGMGTTTGVLLVLVFPHLQRPAPSASYHQIIQRVTDVETVLILYRSVAITAT